MIYFSRLIFAHLHIIKLNNIFAIWKKLKFTDVVNKFCCNCENLDFLKILVTFFCVFFMGTERVIYANIFL